MLVSPPHSRGSKQLLKLSPWSPDYPLPSALWHLRYRMTPTVPCTPPLLPPDIAFAPSWEHSHLLISAPVANSPPPDGLSYSSPVSILLPMLPLSPLDLKQPPSLSCVQSTAGSPRKPCNMQIRYSKWTEFLTSPFRVWPLSFRVGGRKEETDNVAKLPTTFSKACPNTKSKDGSNKNKQMGRHQTKKLFCTAKDTINKMKRQPPKGETIFANHMSDQRLISKIYQELMQFNSKCSWFPRTDSKEVHCG